jgi:glycosyltransferase involved in cell wall biosynthesis
MKILFISHSYPPIHGGVESQNYNLAESLKKICEVKIIANGKGKKWLPIFLPAAFFKIISQMGRYDACLLGNGVLAPLGAFSKIFYRKKKFFCIVHGLDITFGSKKGVLPRIYNQINIPSLRKLSKLLMVGNATVEKAVEAGIDREHCVFVPNGVNVEDFFEKHAREELSKIIGEDIQGKKIILRLARFVPHKGTSWFIKNVMPKLADNVMMVAAGGRVPEKTAGDRDDFLKCQKAIEENSLEKRVKLIPNISQENLKILLNTVDLVVSPNVRTEGSMEGFGINVIEAGACGRVVVASAIEGLKDAIKDGQNGFLIESGNTDGYVKKITELLSDDVFRKEFGEKARQYTIEHYSWNIIAKRYYDIMHTLS